MLRIVYPICCEIMSIKNLLLHVLLLRMTKVLPLTKPVASLPLQKD